MILTLLSDAKTNLSRLESCFFGKVEKLSFIWERVFGPGLFDK
jgi:hypothetical protein